MTISFLKPSDPYLGEGLNVSGFIPSYYIEMDVANCIDLAPLVQIQGGTLDDVTLSSYSDYVEISNGHFLTAKKQSQGANVFPMCPDHIPLFAKAKSSDANAMILVRIYDRPISLQLVESQNINGETLYTMSKQLTSALEKKPGEDIIVSFKISPPTAHQVVRLFSKNSYMQSNINKMTIKDEAGKDMGTTTFTLSRDAYYYAGVNKLNSADSDSYGTYLISKRVPAGALRYVFTEVNIQVVEYYGMEPKPLDYVTMKMPCGFQYPRGGRTGTIDGGLRIRKDATGRSLIKDTYKKLLPKGSDLPVAVVFKMSKDARFPYRYGIEFTYCWNDVYEEPKPYEPNSTSKYKDSHGYSIAIHQWGKKVKWAAVELNSDYSTSKAWKQADDYLYNKSCYDADGLRVTGHFHFFNKTIDIFRKVKPVNLLYQYHKRYPTIQYALEDENKKEVIQAPEWFLPSVDEILSLNMDNDMVMKKALVERINYCGGGLADGSCFWSCTIGKNDVWKPAFGIWYANKDVTYGTDNMTAEYDIRPFYRF